MNVTTDQVKKAKKEFEALFSDINNTAKNKYKETSTLLLKLKRKIEVYQNQNFLNTQLKQSNDIFEKYRQNRSNPYLISNILKDYLSLENPTQKIHPFLDKEINPDKGTSQNPQHLAEVLRLFRDTVHSFSDIFHSNTKNYENVVKEALSESNKIGRYGDDLISRERLQTSTYAFIKLLVGVLQVDRRMNKYKGQPYKKFFLEESDLLAQFKASFRFSNSEENSIKIFDIVPQYKYGGKTDSIGLQIATLIIAFSSSNTTRRDTFLSVFYDLKSKRNKLYLTHGNEEPTSYFYCKTEEQNNGLEIKDCARLFEIVYLLLRGEYVQIGL